MAASPETREAVKPRPRYRPRRVSVPAEARGDFYAAALSALIVFSAMGLFAGLSGLFLLVALHHPSHALAGATLFAVFSAGVVAQLATMTWSLRRALAAGMALMVLGLATTVTAVWLPTPSLALFIIGGAATGAGGGAIFKGAVATVIRISPPETRAEALAGLYCRLRRPLATDRRGRCRARRRRQPTRTLLGFAIAVAIGIVASATKLLPGQAHRRPIRPASNRLRLKHHEGDEARAAGGGRRGESGRRTRIGEPPDQVAPLVCCPVPAPRAVTAPRGRAGKRDSAPRPAPVRRRAFLGDRHPPSGSR